jgi:2,5-diketo-D-gluconate reductase A
MIENRDVFDFELSPDDMAAIDALDGKQDLGDDPRTFAG